MLLGPRITQLRRLKGYTQMQLAAQCGIPQSNLSNIENGKQDLTVSTLVRIAQALGIKPSLLLEEETPEAPVLSRRKIEAIAQVVIKPDMKTSREMKHLAALVRAILPESGARQSTRQIQAAWHELRSRFSSRQIQGICQRVQDAQQRAA